MNNTNAFQKLSVSVINTFIVVFLSIPFYFLFLFDISIYKYLLVLIFGLYNIFFIVILRGETLGAKVLGIEWVEDYSIKNRLVFSVLYTLSCSTIVIWVCFPFDLLLLNLLFIQLPSVLLTGYTLHRYLSGGMKGAKK